VLGQKGFHLIQITIAVLAIAGVMIPAAVVGAGEPLSWIMATLVSIILMALAASGWVNPGGSAVDGASAAALDSLHIAAAQMDVVEQEACALAADAASEMTQEYEQHLATVDIVRLVEQIEISAGHVGRTIHQLKPGQDPGLAQLHSLLSHMLDNVEWISARAGSAALAAQRAAIHAHARAGHAEDLACDIAEIRSTLLAPPPPGFSAAHSKPS